MPRENGPSLPPSAPREPSGELRRHRPSASAPSRFTAERVVRFVLWGVLVFVVGWLLWYFAGLVIYLLIGGLVAYLLRPFVDRLQGIGLGRIPATLVTFLLVFSFIGLLLTFLVPFVARQVSDLSQQVAFESALQITGLLPGGARGRAALDPGDFIISVNGTRVREYDEIQEALRPAQPGDPVTLIVRNTQGAQRTVVITLGDPEEAVEAQAAQAVTPTPPEGQPLEALGLRVRTVMFSNLVTSIENRLSQVLPVQEGVVVDGVSGVFETLFREERITQLMSSIVGIFTDIFYALIIIPFVAFFVLKDGAQIRHSLLRLVPNRYFELSLTLIEKIERNIGRYFQALFIQGLSIATLATILLSIVGLNSALAVGIFAGLANTIPYFGPLMGFLAGTLVGVAQTGDFSLVPGVLVAMGLTQIADNVLFQPLIFSRAAKAHPLVILFVVLIGAQLGGIIGMLVAIPLATVVRVTVEQVFWSLRNYRILQTA